MKRIIFLAHSLAHPPTQALKQAQTLSHNTRKILIMQRGRRCIFRVGRKTRWRLHWIENKLFAYFSSLVISQSPGVHADG